MPSSPCEPGANTIFAGPEKISPSALTISTWMVVCASAMCDLPRWASKTQPNLLERLGLLDGLVDRADHVEGLFGQRVVVPVDDAFEAADGLFERDDLA